MAKLLPVLQPPAAPPNPTGAGPPAPASSGGQGGVAAAAAAPFAAAAVAGLSGGGSPALLGLQLVGVRGWRFSQQAEDIEWLMLFASPDGFSRASAWQVVYSISDRQQWDEIQRFLLPQLTVLRSLMRSMLFGAAGFAPPPGAACYDATAVRFDPSAAGIPAGGAAAAAAVTGSNGGALGVAAAAAPTTALAIAGGAPSALLGGGLVAMILTGPPPPAATLFQPAPHAFKPYRRDFVHDWRYSRTRNQASGGTGGKEAAGCGLLFSS